MATIRHDGKDYAVTDGWHAANTVPWPEHAILTREECDTERWRLLSLSNERHLTDDETAKLAAVTHHYNVRNALKFLGGRPHTDFGFEGADQVHGNLSRHDCGCELHHVFDHHESQAMGAAQETLQPIPAMGDLLSEGMTKEQAERQIELVSEAKARAATAYEHHRKLARWDKPIEVAAVHEITVHPHAPRYTCPKHRHLHMSLDVLHAQVQADNASEA